MTISITSEIDTMSLQHSFTLATHSGKFHTDEVMATAIMIKLFHGLEGKDLTVIRTRDLSLVDQCNFALDIGGVYDVTDSRFDHHQKDAPTRDEGQQYATAGLIWRHYGNEYIRKIGENYSPTDEQIKKIWDEVEDRFMTRIDANDIGEGRNEDFSFTSMVWSYNVLNDTLGENQAFEKALNMVNEVFENLIMGIIKKVGEEDFVLNSPLLFDGQVLVLDHGCSWMEMVCTHPRFEDTMFVVFPHPDGSWRLQCVPVALGAFAKKLGLPISWGGLNGNTLEEASGVSGATFCHKALFICGASSKEAILKMALAAL